jgi:parvulin-like peptidyl-prolyl isomerase
MKTAIACAGIVILSSLWFADRHLLAAEDPEPELSTPANAPPETALPIDVGPEPSSPDEPPSERASSDEIAAVVNGQKIGLAVVNDMVRTVLQDRTPNDATRKFLQAEVLSQLIDRTLVTQWLAKSKKTASSDEIDDAIVSLKQQLKDQNIGYKRMLAERGISEAVLREQLEFQIGWAKYAQSLLTETALRKFFDAHKRDFDGTELRVSHILLRPDGAGSLAETDRLKMLAAKMREQIQSGNRTFEEMAKQFSSGPSRRKGGDLGYIPRRGLMFEQFSTAAFKLDKGEISEPVVSPYGVHLIKVTGIRPGRKRMSEVKDQIQTPAAEEFFEKLATEEREKATIEFTGNCPHFKPGTRELVP